MAESIDKTYKDLLIQDYDNIDKALEKVKAKAEKGTESAVNAYIKLMLLRQEILRKYNELVPKEDTTFEKFQKKNEARKRKKASILK